MAAKVRNIRKRKTDDDQESDGNDEDREDFRYIDSPSPLSA